MNGIIRAILIVLWILIMSFCLTYWLMNHSAGIIPNPPETFWIWVIDVLDAHNRKTGVFILVGLIVSIPIVSLLTFIGWFSWRHFQEALTNRANGHAKAQH